MPLPWLDPENPDCPFPPVEKALRKPAGLLAAGGDLSVSRLLRAYSTGIFPWYEEGQPILWWSPDPRAVLMPERIVVSRSLRKSWRTKFHHTSFDSAFERVLEECAAPAPGREKTWITEDMKAAYCELHALGHAHSIEVWSPDGALAGGLYGIGLGRVFFGESMFSRRRDASKIALAALAGHLQSWGYCLLDCQIPSAHLLSMGAQVMSRHDYLEILALALRPGFSPSASWLVDPAVLEKTFGGKVRQ